MVGFCEGHLLLCLYMAEGKQAKSRYSSYKGTNSIHKEALEVMSVSFSTSLMNYLRDTSFPNTIILGVRFQHELDKGK
jgi:hypothetical protein